jgi:hypothetical protein
VRRCVEWLREATQIATQKATHGIIISVLNYAKYQDKHILKSHTESHEKTHSEAKQKPNRSHNISKEDKEDKEYKEVSVCRFAPPTYEEVRIYCLSRNNQIDAQRFVDFYSSKGWMVGRNKMKDWQACVRTWEKSSEIKKSNKDINFNPNKYDKLGQGTN